MSYYDTIEDDLARAKEILARGKVENDARLADIFPQPEVLERVRALGGAIYGGDTYAAYKLLESFVAEIEQHLTYLQAQELKDEIGALNVENARLRAVETAYDALRDHMAAERRCDFVEHTAEHAELTNFLQLFSDYEEPCQGYDHALAIWNAMKDRESRLHEKIRQLEPWREAIIDACVVDWIFTKDHETDPRKAVNDLLCWQQQIALDPAVSKDAAELHAEIARLRELVDAVGQDVCKTALRLQRRLAP